MEVGLSQKGFAFLGVFGTRKRHQKGIILLVYCLVFSTLSYFKKVYSFLVFSTLVFLVFLVSSAIVSRVPELRRFLVFYYLVPSFFVL